MLQKESSKNLCSWTKNACVLDFARMKNMNTYLPIRHTKMALNIFKPVRKNAGFNNYFQRFACEVCFFLQIYYFLITNTFKFFERIIYKFFRLFHCSKQLESNPARNKSTELLTRVYCQDPINKTIILVNTLWQFYRYTSEYHILKETKLFLYANIYTFSSLFYSWS